MSEDSPVPDPMVRATRTMGIITAVLTGLVAFNTLVYSCANDRDAREETALKRLESEEKFWTEAMKDLGNLVSHKPGIDSDLTGWNTECRLLADRTIVLLQAGDKMIISDNDAADEFEKVGKAQLRVETLRQIFVKEMQNGDVVGNACRDSFVEKQNTAQVEAQEAQAVITKATEFSMSPSVEEAIRQRLPTIALTQPSSDRWDIDVFWCARNDSTAQSSNFTRALNEGLALGAMAQRGDRIAGQQLGRIRVRTLTESAQNIKGPFTYYNTGNRLLYDQGNQAEEKLVRELAGLLNQAGPNGSGVGVANGPITPNVQGNPSKWYISLFICEAGVTPDTNASTTAAAATAPLTN